MVTETPRSLSQNELAERAGTTVDDVRRLVDLGILAPGEDGRFPVADVQRVRLVEACADAGIPAETIGKLIEGGLLSLAFTAFEWAVPWSGYSSKTYRQLAAETGLPIDLVLAMMIYFAIVGNITALQRFWRSWRALSA